MTGFTFHVLVTVTILSSATLSTHAQGKASTSQTPTATSQGEVSARAADIPPPPLRTSRIKNSRVIYVPNSQVKKFPIPSVIFRREGLALPEDRAEIVDKIIYPAINKSEKPIAAIVVEFFPNRPEIGVTLIWHAAGSFGLSQYSSALISRNKLGHFSDDAYLRLFPEEDE